MTREEIRNHITILQEELVPALGCTEPIAVAYAAAKTREVLGAFPEHIHVACSGNIIKNVKSVTVPNSNGLRGIDAAAILGIVGGCAERKLEVLTSISENHITKTRQLLTQNYCDTSFATGVDKLYIKITAVSGTNTATVVIQGFHTNITDIEKNGEVIFHKEFVSDANTSRKGDRSLLTVRSILEFADAVDVDEIKPILDRQIECNLRISEEGMDTRYGAGVARALLDDGKITVFTLPVPRLQQPPRPVWPAVPCPLSSTPAAATRALPSPFPLLSTPVPCTTPSGSSIVPWL